MKSHPVECQLCPTISCVPSPVCQPKLLKCDKCNIRFDAVKDLQNHNKNFHARTKTSKSTPMCIPGRGEASLINSPKPPAVVTSVTVQNSNNTPAVVPKKMVYLYHFKQHPNEFHRKKFQILMNLYKLTQTLFALLILYLCVIFVKRSLIKLNLLEIISQCFMLRTNILVQI